MKAATKKTATKKAAAKKTAPKKTAVKRSPFGASKRIKNQRREDPERTKQWEAGKKRRG
ncbi:MAG: hypothetical protein ACRD7E_29155 [Bryobacteraceae bacterium]